ncbi:response regulator transcription factor [Clostridium sp.]|jgi:DNA-binding response OmpR family regulator|uniref:response regulator transcription factor n=1 Tax=Clostridium sp. TaxID=1506 RepID=UPI002FDD73C0
MKDNIKILVVEDDVDINKLLCDMLEMNGYTSKAVYSGTEALIYLEYKIWNMVLLDLMIPGINGEDLLFKIRENSHIPIIIISAVENIDIRIKTLRMGADDFITKPFNIEEVSARIDSNLRRYIEFSNKIPKKEIIKYREISLNKDTREVYVNNSSVDLTTREFDILELLMSYPKKVFSKANLFESVWGSNYLCDDNTLTVHISNLRNKLSNSGMNKDYIQTIWGIGYKLDVK